MRTFLAIELPLVVQQELERIIFLLQKGRFIEGKYVDVRNLHLTIKFFGEILDKEAAMICDVLKEIKFPSFFCSLGKLGFFGDRILWVDLLDKGSVKKLHRQIEEKLGDFFGKDERFHNHITLARIKKIHDLKRLEEFIEKLQISPMKFYVDEFKLKKSELLPTGPVYEDIASFLLEVSS